MIDSSSAPIPTEQSKPAEIVQPGTTSPIVAAQSTSVTQLTTQTQIPSYVPPHVWTTEVLLDLHDKQNKMGLATLASQENQKKRENRLAWGGFALISIIIVFGLFLVYQNNAFGKDIIGATVLFLAGYLAGQGQKKS